MNTNGGGLSYTHPGMYGMFLIVEATRQLRGECGPRQVADASVAVAHGSGMVLSVHVDRGARHRGRLVSPRPEPGVAPSRREPPVSPESAPFWEATRGASSCSSGAAPATGPSSTRARSAPVAPRRARR